MTLLHSIRFEAIGTEWSVETDRPLSQSLRQNIQNVIADFDKKYSRFKDDSLVRKMATEVGKYHFTGNGMRLLQLYRKLYALTDGKFTPFIAAALENAGYDAQYSFVQRQQVSVPAWDEVISMSASEIIMQKPALLDLGAAGKGMLVDGVASLLEEAGFDEYVIDASGDLRHCGLSENVVGLEHPTIPNNIIGTIDVRNASICGSATNRRSWGDGMHHIFDPHALAPTRSVLATWVVAEATYVADGLATALFFADPVTLKNDFSFEYVRVLQDLSVEYSDNFTGEIF